MRNVQKDKQTQELLSFYQNDTVGRNSHLPYENDKKWDLLQSEMLNCSSIQSEKILFKVLVTI